MGLDNIYFHEQSGVGHNSNDHNNWVHGSALTFSFFDKFLRGG